LATEIAEAARQSAAQLDANRIADVDVTRSEFVDATENLRAELGRTASEQNAQAWLAYLKVAPALDAIESEASDVEIASKSMHVAQRATGVHPGLEVPAVMRVRSAARSYSDALRFRRKERMTDAIGRQLAKFADQWAMIEDTPSPDDLATLQLLLDLLDRTDQNVALVDRTRERFSSANLHVSVDDAFVQSMLNRSVNQTSPVRDCILGTRIVGNATLTGNVTATLLPSVGSIRVRVAIDGTVSSNNTGYNGPVRLRTSGVGVVHATRDIQVGETGVNMAPVVASGSLTTRIDAIEHPLGLVRHIARKKAGQQKSKADRIAHDRFISRITEAFTEETDRATVDPGTDVLAEARAYLKRLDFPEPARSIGSTRESVYAYTTIRSDNQLAAPMPPPPIGVVNEATIQIHESVVNNTLGAVLAGRTMTASELKRLASKTGRTAADQGATADQTGTSDQAQEEREFEIDFDSSRPIIFEARDGKLRLGIRGTRFMQGSRELKQKLEIVALYQPIKTDSGVVVLDRVGEAKINFPGTKRLSVSQTSLRSAIKKAFADAFPETLMDQAWTVPSTVKLAPLQGRTFRPCHFDAQDGWLTLGVGS
jgi:hypothetical protein